MTELILLLQADLVTVIMDLRQDPQAIRRRLLGRQGD
jgi:hypothetical protein